VLQRRDGADAVDAGVEAVDHRHPAVAPRALHALAHLVPAADRTGAVLAAGGLAAGDAGVVALAERGEARARSQQLGGDPLGDRGAFAVAVGASPGNVEGRGVEHAIGKRGVIAFALDDAVSDLFSGELAARFAIVFAVADEGAAGKRSSASSRVIQRTGT